MKAFLCPICSSPDVEMFFSLDRIPVHCNVLHPSKTSAVAMQRGDMRLGFCSQCGHIYNYAFDPALVSYTQTYENSLHFSSLFRSYAESLAMELIERYDVHKKNVIEIGCGKGDFLKLLCDLGENRGLGFDASYQPEQLLPGERFTVVQDDYSAKYVGHHAAFVCCRHVLEHVAQPGEFASQVRTSLADKPDAVVYFEVPNALYTLQDMGIWDLIYEHCSYFTPNSLAAVFGSQQFHILNLSERYGKQFLGIEVKPTDAKPILPGLKPTTEDVADLVRAFSAAYTEKVAAWRSRLETLSAHGKRTVVWGSGSKGTTFLNMVNDANAVEYIVDMNPRKQGKFVSGTGQKIVPPEFLSIYRPAVVIVMNPLYTEEIGRITAAMGLQPEFLLA